jgi:hypothetical protein
MPTLIKIEELFLFGLSIFLFGQLKFAWWIYPALFLVPDISIVGYLAGPRLGAVLYNFIHHKALSISLYMVGYFLNSPGLMLTGLILLGHSSLDRVLGFGLKNSSSFQDTHLGVIGNQAK